MVSMIGYANVQHSARIGGAAGWSIRLVSRLQDQDKRNRRDQRAENQNSVTGGVFSSVRAFHGASASMHFASHSTGERPSRRFLRAVVKISKGRGMFTLKAIRRTLTPQMDGTLRV